MFLRLPFYGLLSNRTPLKGLLDHYEPIAEAMGLIEESLECYVSGGACKEYKQLIKEVDDLEERADKLKRRVRNHLPRSLFLVVDKTLFFNYTRSQDNILDYGQDALHWLLMRQVNIPEEFPKDILNLVSEVVKTVTMLKPALEATIALIHGKILDRNKAKTEFRALRAQHKIVWKTKNSLVSKIYNANIEFKDIHQLYHFIDSLYSMSHSAESCADILRSMIAR